MGGLPSFENICRGELRLNTVSQKKLRLEVKKFWDVCEEANDWDLTSEETEEVASALIAEMAKEYLEDGWAKNGTFVPPGRSFWSSPESDDASPVYMYPRDAERILLGVERIFTKVQQWRKTNKRRKQRRFDQMYDRVYDFTVLEQNSDDLNQHDDTHTRVESATSRRHGLRKKSRKVDNPFSELDGDMPEPQSHQSPLVDPTRKSDFGNGELLKTMSEDDLYGASPISREREEDVLPTDVSENLSNDLTEPISMRSTSQLPQTEKSTKKRRNVESRLETRRDDISNGSEEHIEEAKSRQAETFSSSTGKPCRNNACESAEEGSEDSCPHLAKRRKELTPSTCQTTNKKQTPKTGTHDQHSMINSVSTPFQAIHSHAAGTSKQRTLTTYFSHGDVSTSLSKSTDSLDSPLLRKTKQNNALVSSLRGTSSPTVAASPSDLRHSELGPESKDPHALSTPSRRRVRTASIDSMLGLEPILDDEEHKYLPPNSPAQDFNSPPHDTETLNPSTTPPAQPLALSNTSNTLSPVPINPILPFELSHPLLPPSLIPRLWILQTDFPRLSWTLGPPIPLHLQSLDAIFNTTTQMSNVPPFTALSFKLQTSEQEWSFQVRRGEEAQWGVMRRFVNEVGESERAGRGLDVYVSPVREDLIG
ncbi:hypothetical protein MMC12_007159 [Toensbergia leucococca]|nr:hypothetical protein [Toensbergia leucococca]